MRRLLILTTLSVLALAAPAGAADVRLNGNSGKATFTAAADEVNTVAVTDETTTMLVSDRGTPPTTTDGSCTQVDAASVRCAATHLKLVLGDRDDRVDATGATTLEIDPGAGADTVTGGQGADVIKARDAVRDVIACGAGDDTGEADFEDEVAADCESVVKSLAPPPIGTPTPDGTTTVDAPKPAPAPVPGKSFAGTVKSGKVDVVIAGNRVALDPTVPIPAGATIDATAGTLALTTAADLKGTTQTANFTGGAFTVAQKPGPVMFTELKMAAGDFRACGPAASSRTTARAASKRKIRRLWGSGKGRFRTRGKHSSATVRGTIWSVTDRCDGTLTRVEQGVVVVDDFKRKRSKVLRKGQSYLAKRG